MDITQPQENFNQNSTSSNQLFNFTQNKNSNEQAHISSPGSGQSYGGLFSQTAHWTASNHFPSSIPISAIQSSTVSSNNPFSKSDHPKESLFSAVQSNTLQNSLNSHLSSTSANQPFSFLKSQQPTFLYKEDPSSSTSSIFQALSNQSIDSPFSHLPQKRLFSSPIVPSYSSVSQSPLASSMENSEFQSEKSPFAHSKTMQNNRKRVIHSNLEDRGTNKERKKVVDEQLSNNNGSIETTKRAIKRSLFGNRNVDDDENSERTKYQAESFVRRSRLSSTSSAQVATPTLQCTKIPDQHNTDGKLRRHFSNYGRVVRVHPNPPKKSAVVRFSSSEEAARAKEKGKRFCGTDIHIYFYKSRTQSIEKASVQHPTKPKQPLKISPKPKVAPVRHQTSVKPTASKQVRASTVDERLAVLDKIDKTLRTQTIKQSNLSTATVLKGACPDMCPEKERYLRTQKNLLSLYEMDNQRKVDHRFIVKEYSRSSADQEEALPHELRSSEALRITMDYLITHVMKEIDYDRTAEWYDFLWNRTRAIRKDISIQQSNDSLAIEVTEECARFHICCGHELCEMDLSNFDPKINNENLEKTMKTVLDMYQDIIFREPGAFLPNEAEFRSYFILLNINRSSDVLRAVKNMRLEIRYSDQVRLAVSAFTALHSNNFARFFTLVSQSTYLQAALLHRYFTQIRLTAIRIMAKAYSSKTQADIPVDDVIRMLHFCDMSEFDNFCESCGIGVAAGLVNLHRSVDYVSENSSKVRSNEVSLKMEGCNLGEIVANGRIPSYNIHHPTSSFDENGYYIGPFASLFASLPSKIRPASERPTAESELTEIHKTLQRKGISNEIVKHFAKILFLEVIESSIKQITIEAIKEVSMDVTSKQVRDEIVNESVDKSLREIFTDTIVEEKLERERKQRQAEEAERKMRESLLLKQEEERRKREQKEREIREERERQIREEKEKIEKQKRVAKLTEELGLTLEEEVVLDLTRETALEVYDDELIYKHAKAQTEEFLHSFTEKFLEEIALQSIKEERKKRHANLRSNYINIITAIRLKKWRNELEKVRRYRRSCELFPCTPVSRDIGQQIDELKGKNKSETGIIFVKPFATLVDDHSNLHNHVETIIPKIDSIYYNSLPFTRLIYNHASADGNPLYWKVAVACNSNDTIWKTWIKHKFGLKKLDSSHYSNEVIFRETFVETPTNSSTKEVAACCKVLSTEEKLEHDIFGANALVFVITESEKDNIGEVKSYFDTIVSTIRLVPAIPVLIVTCGFQPNKFHLLKDLGVAILPGISFFSVVSFTDYDFVTNCTELTEGISWLISRCKFDVGLKCARLVDFIEEQLLSSYVIPLYRYVAHLKEHQNHSLDPYSIRELYNKILDDICLCLTDDSLIHISWPAPEFRSLLNDQDTSFPCKQWNSINQLNILKNIFQRLKLPDLPELHSCEYVQEIQAKMTAYCSQVCPNKEQLIVTVGNVIESFSVGNNVIDAADFFHCFPWYKLFDSIASSLFEDVLLGKEGNTLVAYYPSSLGGIELPAWFQVEVNEIEFNDLEKTKIKPLPITAKQTENSMVNGSYTNLTKILETTNRTSSNYSCDWLQSDDVAQQAANQTAELRHEIESSNFENRKFEEDLMRIIKNGAEFLGNFS